MDRLFLTSFHFPATAYRAYEELNAMQHLRRELYPIFEEWIYSNGESRLIMTTKDFRDCPGMEECCTLEDLKFPYDSLDSDESTDSEHELMDNKKLQYSQWATSLYPPPPSFKPPHLSQARNDHRSPPTGGTDRVASPSNILKGNLVTENSKLPILGSRNHQSSTKVPPPTISSTPSPCYSSSSDSCTTPTKDLGERGSPAGASSTPSSNLPVAKSSSKLYKNAQRPPSNSQPVELNGSHIDAGILLSPQLRRSTKCLSSSKLDSRSNLYLSKFTKQSFVQKNIPSVASRIKQFEASKLATRRLSYPIEENKVSSVLKSNDTVEGQNGIDIKNAETSLPPNEQRKSSLDLSSSKLSSEEANQQLLSVETVDSPEMSNLPTGLEEQKMDQVSQTSSMEELSLINQTVESTNRRPRPEAIVPPHKHTPSFNHSHTHYPILYPSQNRVQQTGGSTFLQPPTQPIATSYSMSYNSGKPTYTTKEQQQRLLTAGQQPLVGGGQQQGLGIASPAQQPLGIATATLAMAHNAAANGDIVTLRKLLSTGEVNILARDDFGSTLLHTACTYGQLATLQLIAKEIPPSALLIADNNFLTPPLLAIQGGHLECLKFLVEEMGVALTVPDAGGETLLHHAAFHGQVKCLEYLLHRAKKSSEPLPYVDESGVSPAHFAAQRGHMDCLRLLINTGFDVTSPDRENMKPADWADATGQHSCTQYLVLYELCLQLSHDVSVLLHERQILRQENNQLHELLDLRDKEHHTAIAKLHQQHQETIHKVHEKYAGITVSALLRDQSKEHNSNSNKGTSPLHKSSISSNMSGKGKSEGKEKKKVKIIPEPLTIQEIPPTTPHEVLQRQLSNVEERLNASREMRKHHPVMATRSFSPLSPIVKRMNSQESDTEKSDNEPYSDSNKYQFFGTHESKTLSYQQPTSEELPIKTAKSPQEHSIDTSRQIHYRKSPPQEHSIDASRQIHYRKSPPQEQSIDAPRQIHYRKSPPQEQSIDASRQIHYRKSPPQEQSIDAPRQIHYRKSPPQEQSIDTTSRQVHRKSPPQEQNYIDTTRQIQKISPQDTSGDMLRFTHYQKSPPRDDSSPRDSYYSHHQRSSPHEHSNDPSRHVLWPSQTYDNPNDSSSNQKSPQHKSQLPISKVMYSKPYGVSSYMRHNTTDVVSQPAMSAKTHGHSSYPSKYQHLSHRNFPNKESGHRDSHPLTVTHTSPQHSKSKNKTHK